MGVVSQEEKGVDCPESLDRSKILSGLKAGGMVCVNEVLRKRPQGHGHPRVCSKSFPLGGEHHGAALVVKAGHPREGPARKKKAPGRLYPTAGKGVFTGGPTLSFSRSAGKKNSVKPERPDSPPCSAGERVCLP